MILGGIVEFMEQDTLRVYDGLKTLSRHQYLDDDVSAEFVEVPRPEVLDDLIEENDVVVVCGAFFGDESKGKLVAAVADNEKVKLIARVNSGENAGHTVYDEYGNPIIFHLIPSAVLTGKKCAIGPNCVMDPVNFMDVEIAKLQKNGNNNYDLTVGNVHIVTPAHKIMDAMGTANSSTLKGMSPVHSSKVRKQGLRLDDLFASEEHQRKIIDSDLKTYFAALNQSGKTEQQILEELPENTPEHIKNFLVAEDKAGFLINLYKKTVSENGAFPKRGNVTEMIQDALDKGEKVVLEGPQSYFLSNMVSTHWRSSTSADTTAAGICAAAGYNIFKHPTLPIQVAKVPSSRVGLGGNPAGYVRQTFFSDRKKNSLQDLEGMCDDFDGIQRQFFDSIDERGILNPTIYQDKNGNEFLINEAMAIASSKKHGEKGATTGKPRICGFFDCVMHHKVNLAQGPYLVVSALDRYDCYDKVGLVIGYTFFNPNMETAESNGITYQNGDVIMAGDSVPDENVLKFCHPIIKVMDGWKDNPIAADKREPNAPLPKQAQNFLGAIEYYTKSEIIAGGNGPKTEDLIYLKRVA